MLLAFVSLYWYIYMRRRTTETVAYQGKVFIIEWYYDAKGYSQALEYAESLNREEDKKLFKLFMTLAEAGQIRNQEKFRYEGDRIYAFKPKPHRFMSFFHT